MALRKDLAPLFPGHVPGQAVADRLVDNGDEPHAIDRYLNTRQTGAHLAMSSANSPGPAERVLLAAGTASYDSPEFRPGQGARSAPRLSSGLLKSRLHHRCPAPRLPPRSGTAACARCAKGRGGGSGRRGVLHRSRRDLERGTYYLVSKKSRPADLGESALAARDLLELLTLRDDEAGSLHDQPTVLVILDCCYSGSAGMTMLGEALHRIGNPNTWVIASAGPAGVRPAGPVRQGFLRRAAAAHDRPLPALRDPYGS